MKKSAAIIIILILTLTITLIISLNLNKASIEKQKEILAKAEIILKYDNREKVLTKEEIMLYSEDFKAVLDTSTTEPSAHIYRGLELKDLLKSHNIYFRDKIITISGADGYAVAYSSDEVSMDKNIYIAFMEDGKYLGGRESGGRGPYESIIVSDIFSNRRCKWITEIEVK